MDPHSWPEVLYTYGPYALLPLIFLWVAPRLTKHFLQCRREEGVKQIVCAGFAVAAWTIGFFTAGYIVMHWPPKTVYEGSLGIHEFPAKFVSLSSKLFVYRESTSDADGQAQLSQWAYKVVTDGTDDKEAYSFSLQWGEDELAHSEFTIPLSLLRERKLHLRRNPDDKGGLLYDDDNDSNTPDVPFETASRPLVGQFAGTTNMGIGVALAENLAQTEQRVSDDTLISWLDSDDSYWRAQGYGQLRQLNAEELENLLRRSDLSDRVRKQIEHEHARRQ